MLIVALLVISIAGVMRLHMQTDILGVLPEDMPPIKALKDYRDHFAQDQQLILLLDGGDEEFAQEDAADLAIYMREHLQGVEVNYQSAFEENPHLFAKSVARIWSYAPPEEIEVLEKKLSSESSLQAHLEEVKEGLRHAIDQEQSVVRSYDPLGFLNHSGLQGLMDNDASFESDDGMLRLILVHRTTEFDGGYEENDQWITEIRSVVEEWLEREEYDVQLTMTGGPVFDAEIGQSMEKDMSGTVMITSILVGGLFLLFQKNPLQLLLIALTLGLTFLITLGIGGWLFDTLNLVSVGFAAILLGLVIDYAVVILRESTGNASSAKEIRRTIAPSILWAAMSTSFVFGSLTLSTFTGVRQLGALIAIGLVAGALTTLIIVPKFMARFPSKTRPINGWSPFQRPAVAAIIPVTLVLLASFIFMVKGSPRVNFDLSMVEPETSEAASAFETMQERFSSWSENNTLLVSSSKSVEKLQSNARDAADILSGKKSDGSISQYSWPYTLIPNPEAYQKNHARLRKLAAAKQQYIDTANKSGFSEKGLALNTAVMDAFLEHPENSSQLAENVASDPLTGSFFDQGKNSDFLFAGRMRTAKKMADPNEDTWLGLKESGVQITGWSLLQDILLPRVKNDFLMIFIPCAVLLLIALLVVFRSWKDALVSIIVLVSALLIINGFLVLTGQQWNFLSGMAIPLIVGAGIDYSIHLIFALRRHEGDFSAVWQSVGKAICFCGLSTAVGFGSLLFASTEVLRSMGQLCCAGILLTMALSLLVIPGLWKWCHHRRLSNI
ncbi:MAG: MMPL family transporter [Akkermansiaceae bacterium]